MSMTESKAPTKGKTTRPAKTTKKNALAEKIEAALAKTVRKKKSSQASIERLAATAASPVSAARWRCAG